MWPHPDSLAVVRSDKKGFNEYRLNEGKIIGDWPEKITFYMKGTHYEHYLFVGLHWMVVSDAVRRVFEQYELKGVQLLPVHIVIDSTGQEIGPYWAMHVYQEVDALSWDYTWWLDADRDHSKDKNPMSGVWKVRLRYEPIRNLDIFRLTVKGMVYPPVYISPRIKKALDKTKITDGFEFTPILAF